MKIPPTPTRFAAAFAATLFPALALGDAAPPVMFHALAQEGQNVKIVIEQPENDWRGDEERKLVRQQADKRTDLYSFILEDETPIDSGKTCGRYWYEPIDGPALCARYPESCHECDNDEGTICIGESCEDCTEVPEQFTPAAISAYDDFCDRFPAYAVDCDEDGTAECCLVCESYLLFAMWDRCVPPGEVTYEIIYNSSTGTYTEVEDNTAFTVTESDQNCDPPSTDEPEESDSATEPEDTGAPEDTADTESEEASGDSEEAESTDDTASEDGPADSDDGDHTQPSSSGSGCTVSGPGRNSFDTNGLGILVRLLLAD